MQKCSLHQVAKVLVSQILMLGKTEGKRRRGQQRMSWFDSVTDSNDMNLNKLQKTMKDREAWHAAVHWVTKNQTQLNNKSIMDRARIETLKDIVQALS